MINKRVSPVMIILLLLAGSMFGEPPSVYAGCPSNIIHYWKLDETASPYIDSYGGTNATCTSCPTATTGIINGAQLFNATDQVNVADDNTFHWSVADSFTFEFWMKTNPGSTCSGNHVVVGRKGSSSGVIWAGCYEGGTAGFEAYDKNGTGTGVSSVKVLTDGGWHHVVAVRDAGASEIRIYVDGNLENSHAVAYSAGFDFSAQLNIGWLNSGSGYHFLGAIDEIALYNRALSDIEIQSHYYLVRGYCDMCATPVKIMPLGDSITEGYNGQITDDNYMASYRQKLYLDLTGAGYGVNFVGSLQSGNLLTPAFDTDHEGHAGYTAASCLYGAGELFPNVYSWLTANPADVVLLHIGTNDVNYNCQSAANVSSVLDKIYSYNKDITVLLARIINQKTPTQAVTDYNNSVEAMAKTRIANGDRIIVVDQEHALTYPDDMEGNLHPTQAGYDKMAGPWLLSLNKFLPACAQGGPKINSTANTNAAVDRPYTYSVQATGSPAPTYSLLGTPPSGMTINGSTGVIQWTPTAIGTFDVTVAAVNSVGSDSQSFTINVAPLSITTTTINAPSVTYNTDGIVTVTVSSTLTPTGNVSLTVDGGAALTQILNTVSGSSPPSSSATFTITALSAGTHTLNASFASQGSFAASTVNGTLAVFAKTLIVTTIASNKVYDGATTATVAYIDNRVPGDSVTLTGTAAFADKNVAIGKTVTANGITINGPDAGNYTLAAATATTTADITARPLVITATAANRMYDGTTTVSVTYGDNRLTGDVLTVNGVASFADKNVGTAKAVTITNITISGIDSGNYALTSTTASTTADIIAPDGDLDGDGVVSVTDSLRALRIAGGLIIPTAADRSHGDVAPLVGGIPQPDDSINIGDVVVILRKAVGLVNW